MIHIQIGSLIWFFVYFVFNKIHCYFQFVRLFFEARISHIWKDLVPAGVSCNNTFAYSTANAAECCYKLVSEKRVKIDYSISSLNHFIWAEIKDKSSMNEKETNVLWFSGVSFKPSLIVSHLLFLTLRKNKRITIIFRSNNNSCKSFISSRRKWKWF